ncbi:E3 ubiquitin-protein ligase [Vigna unguiculata]|uniref:RING-type E3 ubiquitin transferase n=1 Tax=Vigna unguiculata TaxID=3917 RepID=A0A4D6LGX8_VIGUN|nr:E3 ubiquitin-protein ligase [Vigna unguiculata]
MSGLDECTIVRGSNIDSHYIVNAYDYGMTEYERVGHQRLPLSSTSSVAPRDARHTATAIPLVPRFGFQDPTPPLENELNELAERIGKVNTGLPDEIIARQMKTEIYQLPNHSEEQEVDLCIICQDEYKNKDQIGILQCGHRYHSDCITTWLHQKNVCPICKSQALTIQ